MAGSASNWFKPTAGPRKGQAVYLSRAQQASALGAMRADHHTRANARAVILDLLEQEPETLSGRSRQGALSAHTNADTQRPAGALRPYRKPTRR